MTDPAPPRLTPQELADLLTQVARRDEAAFKRLYDATAMKLLGIVLRILKRRDAAEDVLQEVYIKIWERAGDYQAGKGAAITWLAAIARNRALDEIRRGSRTVSAADPAELEEIPDNAPPPLAAREEQEEYQRLMRCLDRLEPPRKQMILQAYVNGTSREALAARFGHPVATVKTWLRRGLEAVKGCLAT